jgi:hypothetical protein
VDAGIFHDFHCAWITELRNMLNQGLLPQDYYALAELVPDGLPNATLTERTEIEVYARKQQALALRQSSQHRKVALIEVLSAGNKSNRHTLAALVDRVSEALTRGTHLLLVDLHCPSPRDPQGIHSVIWQELAGKVHEQPEGKPLTLVAYLASSEITAYLEPLSIGDVPGRLRWRSPFLSRDSGTIMQRD